MSTYIYLPTTYCPLKLKFLFLCLVISPWKWYISSDCCLEIFISFHFCQAPHRHMKSVFFSCESLLSVCRAPATEPKKVEKKSFFPPWKSLNEEKMLTATTDEIWEESGLWTALGGIWLCNAKKKLASCIIKRNMGLVSLWPLVVSVKIVDKDVHKLWKLHQGLFPSLSLSPGLHVLSDTIMKLIL